MYAVSNRYLLCEQVRKYLCGGREDPEGFGEGKQEGQGSARGRQSILITRGLRICELACLLNFICNPNPNDCGTVIRGPAQIGDNFELPPELAQGDALPASFCSHIVSKCPFHGLFSATWFGFFFFLQVCAFCG